MADWSSSRLFYESAAWNTLSRRARERDGWQCQSCGACARTGWERSRMQAHHIVSRPHVAHVTPLDVLSNLRTLCRTCHEIQHGRSGRGSGAPTVQGERRAPRAASTRASRPSSAGRSNGSRRR